MSDESDFTERVCDMLHEISQGECEISEEYIESIEDPNQQAVFTGLLMLQEDLRYQAEQRAEAEAELQRRQERQRALFDLAKVAIWDCDITAPLERLGQLGAHALSRIESDDELVRTLFEALTINAVNREGLRMLAAANLHALCTRQPQLVSEHSLPMFRALWKALASGERRVEVQGMLRAFDETEMNVVVGITVPSAEDGFAVLTIADVSAHHKRLAAEHAAEERAQELERINAEVERLFYAVSHDMRAPLRGVHNLAEWALEDMEAGDKDSVVEHMSALRGRVERLERMMNDLLTYARAGRVARDVERVDVKELLDEVATLSAVPEGFAVTTAGELPTIKTVRTLLTQVFLNLVGNALKHHDAKTGKIVIDAEVQDTMVEFRVSDDGPGIPIRYRERVFGLFSTLKPRDEVEGSGMGLAFVQKVVRSVGGRVNIVGPEGRGATFAFTWPREMIASEPEPIGPR